MVDSLTDPVDPDFIAEFQEGTAAQPVPEEFMAQAIAESAKLPAHVWKAAVHGFTEADHLAGLGTITAPALVLWGDQDGFGTRHEQDLLATNIPNAELTVYYGTARRHWEQPDRVVSDLAHFVAERVVAAASAALAAMRLAASRCGSSCRRGGARRVLDGACLDRRPSRSAP